MLIHLNPDAKLQKRLLSQAAFCAFMGSLSVTAVLRVNTLMKLTSGYFL